MPHTETPTTSPFNRETEKHLWLQNYLQDCVFLRSLPEMRADEGNKTVEVWMFVLYGGVH